MSEFNRMMNQKAVALSYDEDKNVAPVIVASGSGLLAEKIIEVANENDIPVYEDNSLASVLSKLELGSYIPSELYAAIVDIYVFFLNYANKKEDSRDSKPVTKTVSKEVIEDNSDSSDDLDDSLWGNEDIYGLINNIDYNAIINESSKNDDRDKQTPNKSKNKEAVEDKIKEIIEDDSLARPWKPMEF